MWGALFYGGRLVIAPYAVTRSPQAFYRLLCREGVTVLSQTPTAFNQLIVAQNEETHRLRLVVFAGESLELRALRPWISRNGASHPQLVNMYGTTETTVHATYKSLTEEEIDKAQYNNLGRPSPIFRSTFSMLC